MNCITFVSLITFKRFLKKKKSEIPFLVGGFIASIIIIFVFVEAVSFLATTLNTTLSVTVPVTHPVRFNISGFNQLGIGTSLGNGASASLYVATSSPDVTVFPQDTFTPTPIPTPTPTPTSVPTPMPTQTPTPQPVNSPLPSVTIAPASTSETTSAPQAQPTP